MGRHQSAIQAADELRKAVWKDRGFPIDPITIANSFGIKVMETHLDKRVSGALIKEKGEDPVIVLHYADSNNRKRFSCAHELGHFIHRLQQSKDIEATDEYEYIDLRSQLSSSGIDSDEIFANNFAANLLMPEGEVKKIYKEKQSIELMALYFDVSVEAMSFRLRNLKIDPVCYG